MICNNLQCEIPGVICFDKECKCRQEHKLCSYVESAKIIEAVLQRKKKVLQNNHESFWLIEHKIDQMIDELSEVK